MGGGREMGDYGVGCVGGWMGGWEGFLQVNLKIKHAFTFKDIDSFS